MTTKVPPGAPILANAPSSPSTQSTAPSTVPSSAVHNNNNNKTSGVATSIITAPLMSQAQSANSMQKQSATNVSVTAPAASPVKSGPPGSIISGPVSTPSTTGSNIKTGTTAPSPIIGPPDPKKTAGVTPSSNITGSSSVVPPKGPTITSGTVPSATPPASVPLTKPTDFNTKSAMNGGPTAVLKQPPPPVTVLPPTPAATPPPVHRQPPSMPQAPAPAANPPPTSNNGTTNNQKSQPQPGQAAVPPPSSSTNNNTPVKQSSISSSAPTPPPTIQKIENQEVKPTQQPPLPVQHHQQGNSANTTTSSPANNKQGVQQAVPTSVPFPSEILNHQNIINNITSGVTDPATKKGANNISIATTTGSNTATTVTSSTATPTSASVVASSGGNSINKPIVQSAVSQPTPVVNSAQFAKSSGPSINPSAKKMENFEGIMEGKTPVTSGMGGTVDKADKGQVKEQSPPRGANIGGGGDAPIIPTGINSNMKGSVDLDNSKENSKNAAGMMSGSNTSKTDATQEPGAVTAEKNETSAKVDLILTKANDMNKSIYIPTSNEEAIIGKSEKPIVCANQNKKDGEIGDDVKRIMEAIESAGLCGPNENEVSKSNRPSTQSNRGGISNGTKNRSLSRPGTAASPSPSPMKGTNATSPTKARPSTASMASRKEHANANGVSGIPTLSAAKSPKEKVAPASGVSNGSPGSLPPKTATSASGLRTSTSRVSSGKVNTAPTTTNKTPNENKTSKAKANGADSCSASPVETETGPSSATGSRSTPRLRPSSSLYRPTASSALKGVSSGPHNSTSNHNLSSSPSTPRSRSSTGARNSRSAITMGDSAGGSGEGKPATLKDQFTAFSRFGNKDEEGKHITLSNCDKWMKQAKVIDGKKITTTDTSICFKKLFKTAKKITFEDFKKYVEELAKSKKMEPQELLDKLTNSGAPGLTSNVKAAHSNVVDRLTDTSKYTGSHKERFDSTGKGRGIEGRKDVPDGSGYVAAFKEKLDLKEKDEGSTSPTPAK